MYFKSIHNKRISFLLCLIAALICNACDGPKGSVQHETQSELPLERIKYDIHKVWTIPNGGYGKVIVVDSINRNKTALKLLGETLKSDTKTDRNAFVFIYDNFKAADLRERIGYMNKKEEEFYDRHFIGVYTRNINSGYHKLEMILHGIDSTWETIDY